MPYFDTIANEYAEDYLTEAQRRFLCGWPVSVRDYERNAWAMCWARRYWQLTGFFLLWCGYRVAYRLGLYEVEEGDYIWNGHWCFNGRGAFWKHEPFC